MSQRSSLVPQAIVFELLLGLVGGLVALGLDDPLRHRLVVSQNNLLRGLLACAPMLVMLVFLSRTQWKPLAELRKQVGNVVDALFSDVSVAGLAAISAAAGLGEEILFRGALQPMVAGWTSPLTGLLVVSLLFGVMHAASPSYFVLATFVGLYFGWLAQNFGDLVAPIVAHALYDFVALLYLRNASNGQAQPANDAATADEQ